MAIYQAATGEWYDSDNTTEGPGVQISAPSGGGSSSSGGGGGDGGSGPPAPSAMTTSPHQQLPNFGYRFGVGPSPIAPASGIGMGTQSPWTGGAPGSSGGGGDGGSNGGASVEPRNEFGRTRAEQQAWDLEVQKAAEAKRRWEIEQNLKQMQFDLEKAMQEATIEYNKAMLKFKDKELAQTAYDNSILASYRNQQNVIAASGQNQQARFQNAQIALQQGEQRQALRRRTPYRSASIRMTA